MLKVLVVAAEASSTHYAENLLDLWKNMGVEVEAFGIGSHAMAAKGFECIGHSEELAVMGIQEVIGAFRKIYDVFYKLVKAADKRKPDVVLLLDYPDFNLRLAKKMKKHGHKVIYYISPSVWAWRTSRVYTIKKYVDKILVLFPFEVDFYQKYGVNVEFVGHPLLDDLKPELFDKNHVKELRQRYGIGENDKVLGLMPGSRTFEIEHHMQVQLDTAEIISKQIPNLKVMIFVAPNKTPEQIKEKIQNFKIPTIFVKRDPFEMVALADFVLVTSGTATLTVGLMEKPMIIMYIMKKFTVFIGQFLIKRTQWFGLVNLISNKIISREFFQEEANPKDISDEVIKIMKNPELYKEKVQELKALKEKLGAKGANQRVAESILKFVGNK